MKKVFYKIHKKYNKNTRIQVKNEKYYKYLLLNIKYLYYCACFCLNRNKQLVCTLRLLCFLFSVPGLL